MAPMAAPLPPPASAPMAAPAPELPATINIWFSAERRRTTGSRRTSRSTGSVYTTRRGAGAARRSMAGCRSPANAFVSAGRAKPPNSAPPRKAASTPVPIRMRVFMGPLSGRVALWDAARQFPGCPERFTPLRWTQSFTLVRSATRGNGALRKWRRSVRS